MKKTICLLAFLVLLASPAMLHAQCTPNASQTNFFVPDTNANFQPAFNNLFYEQVLYVAVPVQTNYYVQQLGVWLPITIDTLKLIGVTGLPACISFESNPVNGKFPGGTKACIRFYGTPAMSDTGVYHLTMNSLFDGKILTFDTVVPAPLTGYRIPILNSIYFGLQNPEPEYGFSVYQNTPNPFNDVTEIAFTSAGNENILFQVFDVLGTKILEKSIISARGYNTFRYNSAENNSGIYFYRLSNGTSTFTRKMSISN
jgi:hypothetical protein